MIAEMRYGVEGCPKQWDQSWSWGVMVRGSYFGLWSGKVVLQTKIATEDLADRTAQKWQ